MKKIHLTQGKYAIVDDGDYEYLMQWKWYYNSGYAVRGANPKIMMHRVINCTPDELDTDHINQNRLDNRRCNLRNATRAQNCVNRKLQSNNTSGFKGVSWHKYHKYWVAFIIKDKKTLTIGRYKNKHDAAAAVDKEALRFSGNFARLNLACSAICV